MTIENQTPTRALSVCQPWAWAIVQGYKTLELRSRHTNHRGPLAIHASTSSRWLTLEADLLLQDAHPDVKATLWARMTEYKAEHKADCKATYFAMGAIVGVVDVVDSVECNDLTALHHAIEKAGLATSLIDPAYWATEGQIAWLCTNARALPRPIAAKGRLGLWPLTPEQQAAIKQGMR